MNNSELITEVDFWVEQLTTVPSYLKNVNNVEKSRYIKSKNEELIEVAFFKIFTKFEKFVSNIFEKYCIGEFLQHNNYCPTRKLAFFEKRQLHAILSKKNGDFILSLDEIIFYSEHVFDDNDNPFKILNNSDYRDIFVRMKILRNYIAHESQTARNKYLDTFCGVNANNFKTPSEVLLKRTDFKSTKGRNYDHYVTVMVTISNYLLGPNGTVNNSVAITPASGNIPELLPSVP